MPTTVNITWADGADFDRESAFESGTTGVYAIYSTTTWRAGSTRSCGFNDIVYIGEGDIGDRLTAHASKSHTEGNPEVRKLLSSGEDLAFKFAKTTKRRGQCLEAALLAKFEEQYGHMPLGNRQAGSCGISGDFVFHQNYGLIEAHHSDTGE